MLQYALCHAAAGEVEVIIMLAAANAALAKKCMRTLWSTYTYKNMTNGFHANIF